MKQKYVPISQYFNDETPLSIEDDFYLSLNGKNEFSVYKSRACFLSKQVVKCILERKSVFDMIIKSTVLNLSEIQKSLLSLLNGEPLLINSRNFEIYKEIFSTIENDDFQHFFGDSPPQHETNFFLSLNSLKSIPYDHVEKWLFQPKFLPGFSIPIGLINLFWNLPWELMI
jgi:hypothetical protein